MGKLVGFCSMATTLFLLLGVVPFAIAKGHDYGEALSKSIPFCEAQRSGYLPGNQRVNWRGNSGLFDGKANGVDLVGGYYDAGDNVKFGLPMAFTVTMISWSIMEYGNQMGASGELSHAMDAVKWGTDYLIKAHPQPHVLYGEVLAYLLISASSSSATRVDDWVWVDLINGFDLYTKEKASSALNSGGKIPLGLKQKGLRVVVTGGAGFVGSHLVDRLMARGDSVIVVDNFFDGNKDNVMHHCGNPRFELIRHDVVDPLLLEVDQIYHLTCPASPVHYKHNPVRTIKTNVVGTLNMLGLAKRVGARFLLTSTNEVYGDPLQHPQVETYWGNVNPIGVRSCYDEGKRTAETLAMDYHRGAGGHVCLSSM